MSARVSLLSQTPPPSTKEENSSDVLSIDTPTNTDVTRNERATPPNEDHGARFSKSTSFREATGVDVEPLAFRPDQDWPDEIELLKRIQRNDGEMVHNEFSYLANNQGRRYKAQEPTSECVLSLEAYGRIEMKNERSIKRELDGLAFENGQMKRLTILSSHLRGLLQEVVEFYPAVDFSQAPLVFYRPYSFLFHFLPSLKHLSKRIDPEDPRYGDLRVLLFLCDRHLSEPFDLIRSTLDVGQVSFFALEALFRPGMKLLAKDCLDQWQVCMCVEATLTIGYAMPGGIYRIVAWHVAWNSTTNRCERHPLIFHVEEFVGVRRIDGLPVFPLDYFKDKSAQDALTYSLVRRGHLWHQIMSGNPTCWMHKGPSVYLEEGGRDAGNWLESHAGRVIVDRTATLDSSWILSGTNTPEHKFHPSPKRSIRFWDNRAEFFTYDDLSASKLTDEQALFCPSSVPCFDLATQKQPIIAVSSLCPVDWNKDALKQLVLPDDKKERIGCLLQNYASGTVQGLCNVIPGKGAGLVFVLHGPPGVGKTLTAESAAEFHEMPMISVRITDLLAEEGRFTSRVSDLFDQAEKLGAILLLDEADVILEARSFEDVKRNSLVSQFLRTVEYFSGILFMTTNRLKFMDAAFQSRIQMAIEYKPLSVVTRRKIWTNIIKRVKDEEAREELLEELDYLKRLDLNGREVQNIMKVAQSLALGRSDSHDGGPSGTVEPKKGRLNISHIKKVAEEALSFQQYFKDGKETSQAQLAVHMQGRGKASRRDDNDDSE